MRSETFNHVLATIKTNNIASLIVHTRAGMSFAGFRSSKGALDIMLVHPPLSEVRLTSEEKKLISYEDQQPIWKDFGIQEILEDLCIKDKRNDAMHNLSAAISRILTEM